MLIGNTIIQYYPIKYMIIIINRQQSVQIQQHNCKYLQMKSLLNHKTKKKMKSLNENIETDIYNYHHPVLNRESNA